MTRVDELNKIQDRLFNAAWTGTQRLEEVLKEMFNADFDLSQDVRDELAARGRRSGRSTSRRSFRHCVGQRERAREAS